MAKRIVNLNDVKDMIEILRDVVLAADNKSKSIGYANTFLGFFGLRNDVGNIISAITLGVSFGSLFNDLESNCDDIIDKLEDGEDILQNDADNDLLKLELKTTIIEYYESNASGTIKTAVIPTEVSIIGVHTANGWIVA